MIHIVLVGIKGTYIQVIHIIIITIMWTKNEAIITSWIDTRINFLYVCMYVCSELPCLFIPEFINVMNPKLLALSSIIIIIITTTTTTCYLCVQYVLENVYENSHVMLNSPILSRFLVLVFIIFSVNNYTSPTFFFFLRALLLTIELDFPSY